MEAREDHGIRGVGFQWRARPAGAVCSHADLRQHMSSLQRSAGTARITVEEGAFVVLWPDAGCTVEEIHKHIGRDVVLKRGSVLIVQCCNWFLDHMTLEGTLILRDDDTDPNGPVIRVTNCVIRNKGWSYYPISPEDESIPQVYRIRGYMVHRKEERVWTPQSQVPQVPSEP